MPSRDETKAWVRAILTYRRLKPTELARGIHRAPSTINRFLNDPDAEHSLSPKVVEEIAAFAGVAPYEMPGKGPKRAAGFAEAEAEPYEAGSDNAVDNVVRSLVALRNSLAPWVLRSNALTTAGHLPGDVLLVDLNERPRPQDVVCAQVYDWTRGQAETVFRIYEPPFLIAATTDPRLTRPLTIDDDTVIVKGVVVTSIRPRRSLGMAA